LNSIYSALETWERVILVVIGRSIDSKAKRIFVMMLGVLSLAIWFSFIALFEHYSATRPNRPDATSGRIYQLNNHGSYAYLTIGEQRRLWCLEFGGLPLLLAAAVLARFWKIQTDPYPDIPGNVRDQIKNGPYQDYEKIRATYESDKNKNDADG
jgi:hypothetical protein